MRWINNLKVGKKLALLIVCSLMGLFAVGITGYYFLLSSSKSIDSMYNERLLSSECLNESRVNARAISADIFRLMVTTDTNENDSLTKDIDTRVEEFNNYINQYKNLKLDSFETSKMKEIDDNLSKYRDGRKIVISLTLENKNQEAYEYYKKNVDTYAQAFLKGLVELGDHNRQIAEAINNTNKSNFKFDPINLNLFLYQIVQ